jgi:hypothetical protein
MERARPGSGSRSKVASISCGRRGEAVALRHLKIDWRRSSTPSARLISFTTLAMRMLKGIQRDGDAVRDAFVAADPGVDLDRWFCDDALVDEATETTYVVSKMWGLHTEPTLASLTAAFPDAGVSFRRAETPDDE